MDIKIQLQTPDGTTKEERCVIDAIAWIMYEKNHSAFYLEAKQSTIAKTIVEDLEVEPQQQVFMNDNTILDVFFSFLMYLYFLSSI